MEILRSMISQISVAGLQAKLKYFLYGSLRTFEDKSLLIIMDYMPKSGFYDNEIHLLLAVSIYFAEEYKHQRTSLLSLHSM